MKSRLFINVLIIVFVLCTLYVLKGQIVDLYHRFINKNTLEAASELIDPSAQNGTSSQNNGNNSSTTDTNGCMPASEDLKQHIAVLEDNLGSMEKELNDLKDKVLADGSKEDDVNAFNEKVAGFNEMVKNEKDSVAQYNAQVNVYNECIQS